MTRLIYRGNNKALIAAIKKANEILNSEVFYQEIEKFESFDNVQNGLTPQDIAKLLSDYNQPVNIETWWNPFGRANAKTVSSTLIRMNLSKVRRSMRIWGLKSVVNTLVHEYVHAVDLDKGELDFTHFDNRNDHGEEDNTAPWAIGKIAENLTNK